MDNYESDHFVNVIGAIAESVTVFYNTCISNGMPENVAYKLSERMMDRLTHKERKDQE